MPILQVDHSGKHLHNMEVKKGNKESFHAFEGQHMSLPQYNSKYKNESNANAIRHLLGGRVVDGQGIN